jgi:hypothetical protein
MSSHAFVLLLFAVALIDSAYTACPTNWTVTNRDCCSPTFGFNSTAPTFHVMGELYPIAFTVWNDSSTSSVSVDTDWTTLNIFWGQRTGSRSMPYAPDGLVDIVRIFYQPGKGLYGFQFHDPSGKCWGKKRTDICSNDEELRQISSFSRKARSFSQIRINTEASWANNGFSSLKRALNFLKRKDFYV